MKALQSALDQCKAELANLLEKDDGRVKEMQLLQKQVESYQRIEKNKESSKL